jgi:hypothetical protein
LEGKVMLWKFGKKVNDMIESQLKPEYGEACNPYDLFDGKLFAVHVRKVGDWNNYDLCQFIGERTSIEVEGQKMQKKQDDMEKIVEYLKTGPSNLTSFDYKDWDDELTEKVMTVIRNTVPDGRLINEITSGASSQKSSSSSYSQPKQNTSSSAPAKKETKETGIDDFFTSSETPAAKSQPSNSGSNSDDKMSSLEDLYADL